MPYTDVSISSEALVKLGSRAITGFDGSTKGARLAEATYPTIRDYMLGLKLWRFCTTTADLSAVGGAPSDPRWAYRFNYPGRAVRIHAVKDRATGASIPYRIQGDKIFANSRIAKATYQLFTPEAKFPTHFAKVLIERCCYEWANSMTGEGRTVERFRRSYEDFLAEARNLDAQNQEPVILIESPSGNSLIARRRG